MSRQETGRTLLREFTIAAQLIADMKRQDANMGTKLAEARSSRAYEWNAHTVTRTVQRRRREQRRALAHSLACAWGL